MKAAAVRRTPTFWPWRHVEVRRFENRALGYRVDVADLDALITDLQRLVDVESPSLDTVALTESASNLADLIFERTGRRAQLIESDAGPHVHWAGGSDQAAKRVLILGHHDTVFPLGALADRPFSVDRGRATGPGVFDMKAGIVQAVHAVAALDETSHIEMLFTADEEVGSTASRTLLEERAIACGNVLVLEPSADGGAVKTGRKGTGTFEVVITGRAAHAGLEPESGRNALVEAAHQILIINEFGNVGEGTTVTPTIADAGTADNVVPAMARIRVDARVTNAAEKARVEGAMAGLQAVIEGTSLSVSGALGRPPMPESASASLFPLAQQVDPEIKGVAVGGGSDGNFTAAIGVPTLDGLGAVGGGAHADHEFVEVDTMPRQIALLVGILKLLR
jgi:glutamate carboxypeptidase